MLEVCGARVRTAELGAAFCATAYRVEAGDEVFSLRIGEVHADFSSWLKRQGAATWGIVTACNPGGRPTPDLNAGRNRALREAIDARGWRHVPTRNLADAGDWPDEPSYCVLDVEAHELGAVATAFGQAAIVFGSAHDGAGRLVWLEESVGESP
jgi:hypothetical protein